jgi:hypothetical protein
VKPVTRLLTRAFEAAGKLPRSAQDQLARELIEEIEWESRWDETLGRSQDKLNVLADKAAEEHRAGETRERGFDEL